MAMTPMLSTTLLRTQTDARLLVLVGDGHERAFEAIVERHRAAIGRYCRRLLRGDRAEDAVQQTFVNAWTALGAGAQVRELRPWLYRIARNACVDVLAGKGYDVEELSASLHGTHGPEVDFERSAVMRETLTAVAALPTRQRDALLATAVQGRSIASLAGELEVSEGAARQLVHRARESLRLAMTVITPTPFAVWLAQAGADGGVARRIAELTATAGGGAAGAAAVKASVAVVAAGALAGAGGNAVQHPVVPRAKAGNVRVTAPPRGASAPVARSVVTTRVRTAITAEPRQTRSPSSLAPTGHHQKRSGRRVVDTRDSRSADHVEAAGAGRPPAFGTAPRPLPEHAGPRPGLASPPGSFAADLGPDLDPTHGPGGDAGHGPAARQQPAADNDLADAQAPSSGPRPQPHQEPRPAPWQPPPPRDATEVHATPA